ncbi:hypothetical protein FZC76_07770 [Sutcliffiella horikoshii]|uniref:Bro-N domain-containing protein n=1 Tax=Sutcliffiella horikoshii TaxID=79883 RepID=A0A5D4SZK6_9BACI|nr:BRO family protein [Sutcliffiella horikoshii]TYS68827.1 hypothetical protein FZC76_07770 [Sutcliffiella horikoshii]
MNKVQFFYNFVANNVETIKIDGETLFFAKDVCELLEIPFFTVNQLNKDEKIYMYKPNNPKRKITLINEVGLYSLALESESEIASLYKDFYENEVIPSLEKYGAYMDDELIDKLLEDEEYRKEFLEELARR